MTGTQSACLLIFGLFGVFLGVWVYLKPVEALEVLWPEPEPDLPPLPEPRFAWREKKVSRAAPARETYAGGRIVSPLFHSPRAAGRWAAEHGVYSADDDVLRLTFCEIVDGVEYRAEPEDATKALLEALERSPEVA